MTAASVLASLDLRPISRLRRLSAALASGRQPTAEDGAWFLAGVRRYEAACLANDPTGLDQALGLGRHGFHAWWNAEARDRRDLLLIELRTRHFAALSDPAAAVAILALAGRATLLRPRRATPGTCASASEMMAEILLTGLAIPGRKQLQRIVGRGTSDPPPACPLPDVQQRAG